MNAKEARALFDSEADTLEMVRARIASAAPYRTWCLVRIMGGADGEAAAALRADGFTVKSWDGSGPGQYNAEVSW